MSHNYKGKEAVAMYRSMHDKAMRSQELQQNNERVQELQKLGESCKTCKYWRRDIEFCNKKKLPRAEYYICHFHK